MLRFLAWRSRLPIAIMLLVVGFGRTPVLAQSWLGRAVSLDCHGTPFNWQCEGTAIYLNTSTSDTYWCVGQITLKHSNLEARGDPVTCTRTRRLSGVAAGSKWTLDAHRVDRDPNAGNGWDSWFLFDTANPDVRYCVLLYREGVRPLDRDAWCTESANFVAPP